MGRRAYRTIWDAAARWAHRRPQADGRVRFSTFGVVELPLPGPAPNKGSKVQASPGPKCGKPTQARHADTGHPMESSSSVDGDLIVHGSCLLAFCDRMCVCARCCCRFGQPCVVVRRAGQRKACVCVRHPARAVRTRAASRERCARIEPRTFWGSIRVQSRVVIRLDLARLKTTSTPSTGPGPRKKEYICIGRDDLKIYRPVGG